MSEKQVCPTPKDVGQTFDIANRPGEEETGETIAKTLGLRYDGIQEDIGMQFTDIAETGTTFYGDTLEEVRAALAEKRRLFAGEIEAPARPPPEK